MRHLGEGGGGKERSAETGQEGLEDVPDVPDYQESLRKYALGLSEQGPAPSPPHGGGKEMGESSTPSHKIPPGQGDNNMESRKRKASSHHPSPLVYPGMPNGYPPYPMPPYHHPAAAAAAAAHHHLQQEGGDRRNGAGGYPPDAYYSPHPSPYRMPPYLPYPNTTKSGTK
jgi:hypothetical protein